MLFVRGSVDLFATTGSIGAENSATASLLRSLLADRNNIDGNGIETHALQQVLGIRVDIQLTALGVLSEVQSRDLRDVLILAFTLFFLQLEGDTTDRSSLDTLHQVSSVTCNLESQTRLAFFMLAGGVLTRAHLVAKTLGSDNGDFIAYSLVGLEIESEFWVVSLDDDFGGLLNGLDAAVC